MHVMFPWAVWVQTVNLRLVGQSRPAQQSISGVTTVVASMAARWEASVGFRVYSEAQYLKMRAFLAQMEGMIGTTDVPALATFRPADRDGLEVGMFDVAGLSDAQTMEHFGFQNAPLEACLIAEPALNRATEIAVAYTNSTGLRPGHRFSIAGSLYEAQLTWDDGARHIVKFQPPLRAAVGAGDPVEINYPRCKMRLATSDEREPEDAHSRIKTFTLNFIEAI